MKKKTGKKEQELKPGRKNAAEKGDRGYKTWTANGVKKGVFGDFGQLLSAWRMRQWSARRSDSQRVGIFATG